MQFQSGRSCLPLRTDQCFCPIGTFTLLLVRTLRRTSRGPSGRNARRTGVPFVSSVSSDKGGTPVPLCVYRPERLSGLASRARVYGPNTNSVSTGFNPGSRHPKMRPESGASFRLLQRQRLEPSLTYRATLDAFSVVTFSRLINQRSLTRSQTSWTLARVSNIFPWRLLPTTR
jgi:hypothetical protein